MVENGPMSEDLDQVLDALERWGRERDWLGPDPYEGLNGPLGRLARGRRPRQAVIQAYKRLPFAPPPPLRVKPRRNAKTVALVLSGYTAARDRFGDDGARWMERCVDDIQALDLRGGESAAWGYHFDFQSRWHFYSATTPNAIATCFAVEALLDAGRSDLAVPARRFIVDELLVERGGRRYFGYTPDDPPLVHNANAMVCGVLARLHAVAPDDAVTDLVRDAATTTLEAQRDDGSWPYGEEGNLEWVDNFHTAYTLEGLGRVANVLGDGAGAVDRGHEFWRSRLFDDDGTARYYPDDRWPVEAHSYASAIDLLVERGDRAEAERVVRAAVRDLWLPGEGRFAFARTPRRLNQREFVRWTNAPMFRALARLAGGLRLRAATPADADLLRDWRNDPEVRGVSGNTHEVAPAEHEAWLAGVLADPDRHLLIAEQGGEPIGQVRLDREGADEHEISVSVAAGARGGGTGTRLIDRGAAWLAEQGERGRVVAYVKPGNERSLRAFAAARFERQATSDRDGFVRLVRELR
jgi:RimJ/RimL family protein N-acetyltransferase